MSLTMSFIATRNEYFVATRRNDKSVSIRGVAKSREVALRERERSGQVARGHVLLPPSFDKSTI